MDLIEHLAGRIGVRFAGTDKEHEAASYIAERFGERGLEVEVDSFRFMGWELLEEPKLRVTSPVKEELPCVAPIYAASTEEGGARGIAEARGKHLNYWYREITYLEKYALVNDSGEDVGYFLVANEEVPVSGLSVELPFTVPLVYIGRRSGEKIKSLIEDGDEVTVELSIKSRFKPGATSHNVIGTLKGRRKTGRFIIVSSHYDTVYDSPGANDDASAVQVLMRLAEWFRGKAPLHSIKFIAYGAEEIGLLGSRHYAKKLQEMGMLDRVAAVINLDEIGVERQNHRFRATNDSLEKKLIKVLKKLDAEERMGKLEEIVEKFPMKNVAISWNSDYAPFAQEGVPTISIGGGDLSTHHRATDTSNIVDRETVELKTEIVKHLIKELLIEKSPE